MSKRISASALWTSLGLLVGSVVPPASAGILETAGKTSGMALVVGPPSSLAVKDLAAPGSMAVQCLVSPSQLEAAQKQIRDGGLSGFVTAVTFEKGPLPYSSHLFDLVVVEDASQSPGEAELLRILAPQGVLLQGGDKKVKPRPASMSERRHDQNRAMTRFFSKDTELSLPFEVRWVNGPRLPNTLTQGNNGQVSAGGVEYKITPLGLSSEVARANTGWGASPLPWKIVARNAFNGVLLWEAPYFSDPSTRAKPVAFNLAVDANRAYFIADGKVVGVKNTTGAREIETPAYTKVAFIGALPNALLVGRDDGVYGHSLANGSFTWKYAHSNSLENWMEANGRLFLQLKDKVVGLDAATGNTLWTKNKTDLAGYLGLATSEENILAVLTAQKLHALDPATGNPRWSGDMDRNYGGVPFVRIFDGKIQVGASIFSLADGSRQGTGKQVAGAGCQLPVLTPRYTVDTRIAVLGLDSTVLAQQPMSRVPCNNGTHVSNGLVYGTPEDCVCNGNQIQAHVGIGHADRVAAPADFTTLRTPQKGPAAVPGTFGSAPDDWPTFRGNDLRTFATTAKAPTTLRLMDQQNLSTPRKGLITQSWRTSGAFGMTPPVVAGGRIFMADIEAGTVHAYDEASKRKLWSFSAQGRVSISPTIAQGFCLIGSHDGYVYCLRADDGGLIWKNRVAPIEKRIAAFGMMESPWPVASGIVVNKDTVLAAGGYTSTADGGIAMAGFRLSDGTQFFGSSLNGVLERNWGSLDVLQFDGKQAWMRGSPVNREPKKWIGASVAKMETPRINLNDHSIAYSDHYSWRAGMISSKLDRVNNDKARHNGRILAFDANTVFIGSVVNEGFQNFKPDNFKAVYRNRSSEDDVWAYAYDSSKVVLGAALYSDACLLVLGIYTGPAVIGSSEVILLNRQNGSLISKVVVPDEAVFGGLALKANRAYLTTRSGRLYTIGDGQATGTVSVKATRPEGLAPDVELFTLLGRKVPKGMEQNQPSKRWKMLQKYARNPSAAR